MYDKKTAKPLRACVPVDPFESAPRRGYDGGERAGGRRKDEADYGGERLRGGP